MTTVKFENINGYELPSSESHVSGWHSLYLLLRERNLCQWSSFHPSFVFLCYGVGHGVSLL